jgi:hypothetical protein
MSRKYFTVEEANHTLPLVRRIVADIVEEYRRWRERVYRYELADATRSPGEPETEEQVVLRRLADESVRRMNGYMEELGLVGCILKGLEEGLVDFYSKLEGRDVFLCWKLGEPEVSHWHELDAGYAGRRPLTSELVERGKQ